MLNKTLDYILAHKRAFIALGTAIFLAVVVIVSNIIYLAGQDQAAGNRPMVTISAKPVKTLTSEDRSSTPCKADDHVHHHWRRGHHHLHHRG